MPLRISRSALNSPHKKESLACDALLNINTKVGSVDDKQSSHADDDDDSFTCED